ncbi:hypothetical protein CJ014_16635 [Pleomorphomonas carboxyditropha]|uniref:Uncharacterized protein n=1 Tax=Pleomorphomonas carboxyditropha TaxID=2023338 RepID=A0A2G9WUB8_9HYPH|nr:hypothetical protein CJ014_16635 [Pleomorphomonas carboxyditropha]
MHVFTTTALCVLFVLPWLVCHVIFNGGHLTDAHARRKRAASCKEGDWFTLSPEHRKRCR